jgi:hypothetical protein
MQAYIWKIYEITEGGSLCGLGTARYANTVAEKNQNTGILLCYESI